MNSGLYAACAGLVAQTQALDLAANNLANVNTTGYKGQVPTFRSLLANDENSLAAGNPIAQAVNDFAVLAGSRTDLLQGSLEKTGSDFDFAVQGDGWFAVETATGRLYTRNGNFHVDSSGRLATAEGYPVSGAQGSLDHSARQVVGQRRWDDFGGRCFGRRTEAGELRSGNGLDARRQRFFFGARRQRTQGARDDRPGFARG